MVTVRYKNYFLDVRLASDHDRLSAFSPVARTAKTADGDPMVTLFTSDIFRTEEDAIIGGFQLAAAWIDETLPVLLARPRCEEQEARRKSISRRRPKQVSGTQGNAISDGQ